MYITRQDYNQIMLNFNDDVRKHNEEFESFKAKIYDQNPTLSDMEFELKSLKLKKVKLGMNDADTTNVDQKIKVVSGQIDMILSRYKLNKKKFNENYRCNKCKDTGYVGKDMCSCFKKYVIDYKYKNSNLREQFKKENFDTFRLDFYSNEKNNELLSPRENAKIISGISKDFCNNFDKKLDKNNDEKFNLLFYGAPGLGKTFMCNAIAKELLDACYSVVYYSACEISKTIIENAFNHGENKDDELTVEIKNVYDADLLILDDLGTESNNSIFVSELFNIINFRKINHKPTIISTNLSIKDLRDKYTERISSRFIESYELLMFFGDNIREVKNNMD